MTAAPSQPTRPSRLPGTRLPAPPGGLPEDALVVATAGRPHGVGGELRLVATSGDPERLAGVTTVWVPDADDGEPVPRRVESFRLHAGAALVRLEGFPTREDAARLTRKDIWARAAELPPWGPDGFGLVDVVGARLLDGDREVGEVVDVVNNAGRDFFEVQREGRRVLVPAVKDWLVEMDLPGGRIVMRLPEGLLD